MEKILSDTLLALELTDKERLFMKALYMLGSATVPEIARTARLERSTAYLISQTLREKEFITEDFTHYKKRFTAAEPKSLLRMIAAKQRRIRRQEMILEEKMGELESYYSTSQILPKVHVFQGKTALLSVWNDVLTTTNEILLWTNQKTESLFFTEQYHTSFIAQRIKKRIPIRVLAVHNSPGKKLLESDKKSLRESRLLPTTTSFSAETYLYDNKIAMLDYQTDTIGIIIESEAIATTQKEIFEMTWRGINVTP